MLVYSSPHPLPYTVCWLINSGDCVGSWSAKGLGLARKESVVGGIKREGLEAEGLKGVDMGHRRSRGKCSKEQMAKIGG